MRFIYQCDYGDVAYPTNMKEPDCEIALHGTVKQCGCGICSAVMLLDMLLGVECSVPEVRDMSLECSANMNPGTSMEVLGAYLAGRFDMTLEMTDDMDRVIRGIGEGAGIIVNVGGNHDDHPGIFSDVGHFIVLTDFDGKEFEIADPQFSEEKFAKPHRSAVRVKAPYVYGTPGMLEEDTTNRSPAYYIFRRKYSEGIK